MNSSNPAIPEQCSEALNNIKILVLATLKATDNHKSLRACKLSAPKMAPIAFTPTSPILLRAIGERVVLHNRYRHYSP